MNVRTPSVLVAVLSLSVLLTACDSTEVDPFLVSDQYFSIYGSLDMQLKHQYIRVVAIDTVFGSRDDTLDAVVMTTDLITGEVETWSDSVFTFDDGKTGHVFNSGFRIKAGHTYRIEVERSDGAVTWAETTVPLEPQAEFGESSLTSPPEAPLPTGFQEVFWRGLTREPNRVTVYYRYRSIPANPFIDVAVPYETRSSSEDTSEGWEITVSYTTDRDTLNDAIGGRGLRLAGVAMQVIVLAEDWVPPGGVWDPEVLSQPGVFSNVNNGFGFFGSAGRYAVEWIPGSTDGTNPKIVSYPAF
jgi:hypothetical protein